MRLHSSEPNRIAMRIRLRAAFRAYRVECVLSDSGDAGESGLSILVVESDPAARVFLVDHLRRQGFRVVESEHGGAAIGAAAAQPFDYVVVDIDWVGVSDGAALARWTRTKRPLTRVVLTSTTLWHLFPAGSTMAALPLIRKPFRQEDLERVLSPVAVAATGVA
jgi:DNA-binding response OmpR family regulator